jgi:hypothetical protein
MGEITKIPLENCFTKVNYLKNDGIWYIMQEKKSDICLRFGAREPTYGRVPFGTDISI